MSLIAAPSAWQLVGAVLLGGLFVYLAVAFVLVKLLRDRYRSVPASHVTAAGAAIFMIGIGLLYLSGEQVWDLPFDVALISGAVGAAIVNVGATMIVGPWLAGLVASDLRRVPLARGPRGTEAQLATSLVRIATAYGGTVAYERELPWDFNVCLGRRDLRVELGAVTVATHDGDEPTNPRLWVEKVKTALAEEPPSDLRPVLIVVNRSMLQWLRVNNVGFGDYDDNPYLGFQRWDGRAKNDAVLHNTVEALLFGITNSATRAALAPVVPGLGTGPRSDPMSSH